MFAGIQEPPLLIAGISHRQSGVEAFARAKIEGMQSLGRSLNEIKQRFALKEVALVDTCNRFELLASAHPGSESEINQLKKALPQGQAYFCGGAEAVRHFYRVIASLDSMIVGESQIVSQIKRAYSEAIDNKTSGPYLHRLFQSGFHCSKQVRTHTALTSGNVSVVSVGIQLLQQVLGDLKNKRILLLGAGATAELCLQHLYSLGCRDLIVANRSIERALELANLYSAAGIELEAANQFLPKVDVVISALAGDHLWLELDGFRALNCQQTICWLDLAMPQSLDPRLSEEDGSYLFSLNDLMMLAEKNKHNRLLAAKEAEVIVDAQVLNYLKWSQRFEMKTQISKLQERAALLANRIVEENKTSFTSASHALEVQRMSGKIFHEFMKLKKVV